MYTKLRALNPRIPRNSARRSADSRSMTFMPQPSLCCRSKTSRPIRQYKSRTSWFTDRAAPTRAARTVAFNSANKPA